jgi:hypothetical protein
MDAFSPIAVGIDPKDGSKFGCPFINKGVETIAYKVSPHGNVRNAGGVIIAESTNTKVRRFVTLKEAFGPVAKNTVLVYRKARVK